MKVSLDTNILIDEPQIVFDKDREFVLSFTVIRELDNLKRNPDVKRAAQAAIRNIWIEFKDDKIEILNVPDLLGESPDEKIIQDTKDANASILSNDIAVRIIAHAHGIPISDFETDSGIDYDYTGYILITGDLEYENKYKAIKEMQREEFETQFNCKLRHNQYVIVERMGDKNDIWVCAEDPFEDGTPEEDITYSVKRISQSMTPFRQAGVLKTPLDDIQMCALHAVFNNDVPLTVIDGKLGTGKTMLSVMGALGGTIGQKSHVYYKKIIVTKSPESINKGRYTGYKPGTTDDKLGGHLGGFKSNLSFLVDKENKKKLKPGEEPKPSESDEIWQTYFKVKEIDEMQGDSIHDEILLVDEWQLLDEDGALLVLSRIAAGSKVVLIGDTENQTYGLNRANEGYKILYQYLGDAPEFSYIELKNIYRSRLATFVARIYEGR